MQCGSLAATKPDPITNTTQFFQGDTLFGAFRSFHNALADVVVTQVAKRCSLPASRRRRRFAAFVPLRCNFVRRRRWRKRTLLT